MGLFAYVTQAHQASPNQNSNTLATNMMIAFLFLIILVLFGYTLGIFTRNTQAHQASPNRIVRHVGYGMATISRLLKIIGLFCRISSLLLGSFAKETCYLRSLLIIAVSLNFDLAMPGVPA